MCFLAMLNANIQAQNNDADMWANRGDYWIKKINPIPQYKAKKRRMIHKPLVLSGHGIRLNIDRSTLLIKCGFTHYPQAKEEYRFFPKDRQLPSRIVILDGDGSITFDALEWLSEQNVPLVQINWKGEIASVGGSNYASNHELSEYQLKVKNSNKGLEYAKWLIKRKIEYCRSTILYLSGDEDAVRQTLELLDKQIKTLKKAEGISDILSAEGMAAFYYFRSWQSIQLRWRGVGKKPIPQEWYNIGTRIGSTGKDNSQAMHPVNAILNYAYAVLENQVRAQILKYGVDPTIAYLHANNEGRCSLVFDLMEPVRPIMDKRILEFIADRTFSPDDFILNKKGLCRLHPQFARFIVKHLQDIPEIEKITADNLKKLFAGYLSESKLNKVFKVK